MTKQELKDFYSVNTLKENQIEAKEVQALYKLECGIFKKLTCSSCRIFLHRWITS